MEITLEQVEKLRARAELSYEEARALLERCGALLLGVFPITAPLAVLGLILGYRYRDEKEK